MDIASSIPVITSILVTEALLSVDNVLVIVSLTGGLNEKEQQRARFFGIIVLGAGMRILTLGLVSFVKEYSFVLYFGALYLVWVALSNLYPNVFDEFKNVIRRVFHKKEVRLEKKHHTSFWKVVLSIAITDLVFSLDNVIVAVGLSPDIMLVRIGVIAGIIMMFFASSFISVVVKRYPMLEKTGFVIVGIIGITMLVEHALDFPIGELEKFSVITLIILGTIGWEEKKKRKYKGLI